VYVSTVWTEIFVLSFFELLPWIRKEVSFIDIIHDSHISTNITQEHINLIRSMDFSMDTSPRRNTSFWQSTVLYGITCDWENHISVQNCSSNCAPVDTRWGGILVEGERFNDAKMHTYLERSGDKEPCMVKR